MPPWNPGVLVPTIVKTQYEIKTHHNGIFRVRPRYSKPGMELFLIQYRPIIMVGLVLYNACKWAQLVL